MIFEHWINAIGDKNAARLKSLSFFSHNFRVNIRVSTEKPPNLILRFRTSKVQPEIAEGVPKGYTFDVAARRAEAGIRFLLDGIQADSLKGHGLSVRDAVRICEAVDKTQPFLCRRISLGWQNSLLLEDSAGIDRWPSVVSHSEKCDECGYHRFTRGSG